MKKNRGFTLVELMIVVAVMGILAAIAFPSYRSYVMRSNRTVAKTALMKIASQQESFFNDRKQYALFLGRLGLEATTGDTATFYVSRDGTLKSTATPGENIYTVTLRATATGSSMQTCNLSGNPTATAFAVEATPIGPQTKDLECLKLCVNSAGDKGASGSKGVSGCWRS